MNKNLLHLKKVILLILLNTLLGNLFSQTSIDLGLVYAPHMSKIVSSKKLDKEYTNKLYHSFGVRGEIIYSTNFYVASGLFYQNNGATSTFEITTVNMPEGTGTFKEIDWNLRSLVIPIDLGYYFLHKERIRLGGAVGITNEFLLQQEIDTNPGTIKTEVFGDYFFGVKGGLNLRINLKEKVCISFYPSFVYHLNKNNLDYNITSYGVDIGISYKLK